MSHGRIVRPIEYPIPKLKDNFFFLLGPNAVPPWQEQAITLIQTANTKVEIISPCHPNHNPSRLSDAENRRLAIWELHYLREAWKRGILLCWFPAEQEHRCDEPFAQNCRDEFGRSIEQHIHNRARLVVGIEPGYGGGRFLRTALEVDCQDLKVPTTLAATCNFALAMFNHEYATSFAS